MTRLLGFALQQHWQGNDSMDNKKVSIGIAMGVGIGLLLGIVTDNIPLWLGMGSALGVAISVSLFGQKPDDPKK